jgi:hypothetical protein
MSHTCLIRFAPIACLERYNDPKWQGSRTMYDPGSLKMPPGKTSVPLWVDHDEEQVVGTVTGFSRFEDVDGPWFLAHATIDRHPAWLRSRETRASFGYKSLQTNPNVYGCEVVRGAIVTEVSILSPARMPAEPLARVCGLWEEEAKPLHRERVASQPSKKDAARHNTIEHRIEALGRKGIICRPNIGQVLRVY